MSETTIEASGHEPEPDPLAQEPDVAPDPEGSEPEEDQEPTIPAGGEPGEDHPAEEVPF